MTNVQATVGRVGLLAPVAGKERLEVLDLLRGFALFGILLVNMSYFKAPGGPAGIGNDAGPAGWFTIFGLLFLVESKFFTLFSFLFGLGFAVQLSRGATQPAAFNQRFLRRLAILALFGIAHILLLWEGDILLLYALVGGLLFLFRRASERTLLRWIWWLWLIPTLLFSLGFGGLQLARQLPTTGPQLTQADLDFTEFFMSERTSSEARYQAISYGESIRLRLRNYATTIPLLISRIPTVLAMFLLGFYVGKQQILVQIGDQLSLLRRVRWWGLTVGLSGSLLITLGFALLPPIST